MTRDSREWVHLYARPSSREAKASSVDRSMVTGPAVILGVGSGRCGYPDGHARHARSPAEELGDLGLQSGSKE